MVFELARAWSTWPDTAEPLMNDRGSDSLTACAFSAGKLAAALNACRSADSSEAGRPAGAAKSSERLLSASASVTAAPLLADRCAEDIAVCRVGTPLSTFW